MSDLISRQAAIDVLGDMPMSWADTDAEIQAQEDWKKYREALLNLPTAEKKGEWIPVIDGNYIIWECSECHVESEAWTDYCPICGSRNIEETDEGAYEEALEEFLKNPKTYTLDEVEAELGLTAKKGKWVPNNVVNAVFPWCCFECNSNQADRTPYCQMCGARMEENDETDRC